MNIHLSGISKGNRFPHPNLNLSLPTNELRSDLAAKQLMTKFCFPSCLDIEIADNEFGDY